MKHTKNYIKRNNSESIKFIQRQFTGSLSSTMRKNNHWIRIKYCHEPVLIIMKLQERIIYKKKVNTTKNYWETITTTEHMKQPITLQETHNFGAVVGLPA